jgi:CRISPR/Cas system CSM-associated protein Csm3 (group 7 of RAMP superfamily)
MYKKLLNEMILGVSIQPVSPLLIKSSKESGADPLLPSMNFVRSPHPESGTETIYIPGSSLKGVIRSRSEQIVRSLGLNVDEFTDFSLHNRKSRTFRDYDQAGKGSQFWREICSITRLFGSNTVAARIKIPDFYPRTPVNTLPVRQMVAIDRRSGSSANTFTMEVAPAFVDNEPLLFEGEFYFQNFERWQLGLLAIVLKEMDDGLLPVGFASGRGLGRMRVRYNRLRIRYPGLLVGADEPRADTHILGIGELATDADRDAYGFHHYAEASPNYDSNDVQASFSNDWGARQVDVNGDSRHVAIETTLKSLVPDWADYVRVTQESEVS